MGKPIVGVGLVHFPVVNKKGQEIAAALTPTDLHDLARSARTFGVEGLWVITPLKDQQKLAGRMLRFWKSGTGAEYNPNRGEALDLIEIVSGVNEAVAGARDKWGLRPLLWATAARSGPGRLDHHQARAVLKTGRPVLVLFGTAWGLAPDVLRQCDDVLAPIDGGEDYNHLSVRSAAAVMLDRLLGRDKETDYGKDHRTIGKGADAGRSA